MQKSMYIRANHARRGRKRSRIAKLRSWQSERYRNNEPEAWRRVYSAVNCRTIKAYFKDNLLFAVVDPKLAFHIPRLQT